MVFPIADLRTFVAAAPRLSQPHWSNLMEDQDFMHFVGTVRGRINDGDDIGKAEESLTVRTRRGIQFAAKGALHHQPAAVPSVFFCAYRRFYFDTHATAKFEVAISDDKPNRKKRKSESELDAVRDRYILADLMRQFLDVRVNIRDPLQQRIRETVLGRANKPLAQLYLAASTPHNELTPELAKSPWVEPGAPLLIATYNTQDTRLEVPAETKTLPLLNLELPSPVMLQHYTFATPYGARRVWIISYSARYTDTLNFARNLRIYLTQLHVEHESLRRVLDMLRSKRTQITSGSVESQSLQDYLNQVTKRVSHLENKEASRFGKDLPHLAKLSLDTFTAQDVDALTQVMTELGVRPQVQAKVVEYGEKWQKASESGSPNGKATPAARDKITLRDLMAEAFKMDELESLCFEMEIDSERFLVKSKSRFIEQLIEYCARTGSTSELIAQCKTHRSTLSWPEMM